MKGWIKLHRCLFKKPIWVKSTLEQKVILITLLTMANHEENEWEWQGQKFAVEPGQFVTSLDSIAKLAGVTTQNVRTALVRFEKLEFLTNQSTKTGRLITIVNWGLYQDEEIKPNIVANKDLTKTSQRPNKDLTPNKNDKNDKNDKKINYAEFVSLKENEYQKLVDQHGEPKVKRMIEVLDAYKGSTGKKYKDDYRTILNWVVGRVEEEFAKKPLQPQHQTPPPQPKPKLTDAELKAEYQKEYNRNKEHHEMMIKAGVRPDTPYKGIPFDVWKRDRELNPV